MDKKPSILIFSVLYFPHFVGGAEIAVREVGKRLHEKYDFHMITLRTNEASDHEIIDGIHVHRIGSKINMDTLAGKIQFFFRKNMYFFSAQGKAMRLHKTYKFSAVQGLMAAYAGMAAYVFKKRTNVPMMLSVQDGDPLWYLVLRALPVLPWYFAMFRSANVVQAISAFLEGFSQRMGAQKTVIIPNGVDIAHFSKKDPELSQKLRSQLGYSEQDMVLITTSRLVKKNGLEFVIRALAELPEHVKFLIIGIGGLGNQLKQLARNLGVLDRVKFFGFVRHEELPKYLHASDIFIRPSLTEGMGNSFIEAMAAEIPVIATPAGGIVDFVFDKETGMMVKIADVPSIVEAVNLIQGDAELRERLIKNGKALVDEKYDWDQVAEMMDEEFGKIINNK